LFDRVFRGNIYSSVSDKFTSSPKYHFTSSLLEYRVIQDIRKLKPDLVNELALFKAEQFNEFDPKKTIWMYDYLTYKRLMIGVKSH